MAKKNPNIIRQKYPPIKKVLLRGEIRYEVDCRKTGVSNKRPKFKTIKEAENFADNFEKDLNTLGVEGVEFPTELRVMAQRCQGLLEPYGKNIEDATVFFITHLNNTKTIEDSRLIKELVSDWLHEQEFGGFKELTKATLWELSRMGNLLVKSFGERRILEIDRKMMETHISKLKNRNLQSKKNLRTKWGQFFNWAKEKEYITQNPLAEIYLPPISRTVEIYSAQECADMMEICEALFPEMVPFIAISLFAGLRPQECFDLQWEDVLFDTEPPSIRVKKSTQVRYDRDRYPRMEENLVLWLQPYREEKGPIRDSNHHKRLSELKIACGFNIRGLNKDGKKFIPDGFRHSYASYFIARYHDEAKLAVYMGNSVETIRTHYLKGITPKEEKAFWEIVPGEIREARQKERQELEDMVGDEDPYVRYVDSEGALGDE